MKKSEEMVVIQNGQLIDGTGSEPVPNGCLVIEKGVITYSGPADNVPQIPSDAKLIDANGGSILPGLVEAHFHPTYFNVCCTGRSRHQVSGRVRHHFGQR